MPSPVNIRGEIGPLYHFQCHHSWAAQLEMAQLQVARLQTALDSRGPVAGGLAVVIDL